MSKKKLGRGLENIFGEGLEQAILDIEGSVKDHPENAKEISLDEIRSNPHQPRKHFDAEKLQELATSIKEYGVFTPIIVKKSVKGYELIAGERRTKAARLAGLETIPAIIVEYDESQMMEVALIENIQREQLNVIEEAVAYNEIINRRGFTQAELAEKVGKSRSHITNTIRLLELPKFVREDLLNGHVTMGHVKPLIGLDEEKCQRIIDEIKLNNWSVRKVEEIVNNLKEKQNTLGKTAKQASTNRYSVVEEYARQRLGTKVTVKGSELKIKFNGDRDLNRILEILGLIEN